MTNDQRTQSKAAILARRASFIAAAVTTAAASTACGGRLDGDGERARKAEQEDPDPPDFGPCLSINRCEPAPYGSCDGSGGSPPTVCLSVPDFPGGAGGVGGAPDTPSDPEK